jgi:L-lactate dehydrogenase complex protein LldG
VSDREAIFARIRDGLRVTAPRPGVHDHPSLTSARHAADDARDWLPPPGESPDEWLALFATNSAELRTQFLVCGDESAAQGALAALAAAEGWRRVATHEGALAPAAAAATGSVTLTVCRGTDVNELERCDAGITECDALIAQTGSVLLTARSGGGRALSVLPPHHVVLARREQLLPDLPAAFALLHKKYGPAGWPGMMTFITGPSRTGDIERILVLGAHGPKKLTVILF